MFLLLALVFVPRAMDAAEQVNVPHDPRVKQLVEFMESNHFTFPLYAENFIEEADRNNLPFSFLPCVERQESGGGRHYIAGTFNPFGWASGTVAFESEPAAVAEISYELGSGNHYALRSVAGKLAAYNPRPAYAASIESCIRTVTNEPQ